MLLVEAGLMVLPLVVGLVYRESIRTIGSFLIVIAVSVAIGFAAGIRKPKSMRFYTKEGLVIASLSWFVLSFFGGLPFVIGGEIPSIIDAFFETASGFTTTGSTILTNIEAMSHSMLFWRSFTHLIGGMGVIVFALAVLPSITSESVHIMKAEVPGPTFGKLVSKIRDTARILYIIYLSMTAVLIVLLMLGGMDWFDASVHAFGAAGTGGFSSKNVSILYFNSAYIEYVLGVAMILFGANFNLYYLILIGQVKKALKSEELRWYLIIVFAAVAVICFNMFNQYESFPRLFRDAFFAVSSIITTTGYSTVDFGVWPVLSHVVLLLIMFIGACAGSTGGGLKVSRVGVLVKTALSEIRKSKEPSQVVRVRFEGNPLSENDTRSIGRYFTVYVGLFFIILLLVSLDSPDFLTAFSAVAATFNNIGPGLSKVGPMFNYSAYSDFSKLILSIGMIAGRLELFPVLVLFLPSTWRRRG
jgi:trk system potassium uptake protein TrkH